MIHDLVWVVLLAFKRLKPVNSNGAVIVKAGSEHGMKLENSM
jgi:hypothetical protein